MRKSDLRTATLHLSLKLHRNIIILMKNSSYVFLVPAKPFKLKVLVTLCRFK